MNESIVIKGDNKFRERGRSRQEPDLAKALKVSVRSLKAKCGGKLLKQRGVCHLIYF